MAVQQGVLQPGGVIRPAAAAVSDFLANSKPARIGASTLLSPSLSLGIGIEHVLLNERCFASPHP